MKNMTLSQRLTLVFIILLVACCTISGILQVRSSNQYSQAVIQRLSQDMAKHIAETNPLLGQNGLNTASVHTLFDQLMAVNPSVEVYLLDKNGKIIGDAAPVGSVKLTQVNLQPIHALLEGAKMPVYGENPRHADRTSHQVFSAAPLLDNGQLQGYVYIVLLGDQYSALDRDAQFHSAIMMALRSMGLVILFGLVAGAIAFRWVTRPIRRLTAQVSSLDSGGMEAVKALSHTIPAPDVRRDEVFLLQQAFITMAKRIDEQWQRLTRQDQQRREFIANISHDLRTPLTSLHGYLETLSVKSDQLSDEDRHRYLNIALVQSKKVGRLAQELFELARLEYGVVKPQKEPFSMCELVQDVYQKFELAAETRHLTLQADMTQGIPLVNADLAMIERVMTNLLDNAIRFTPDHGTIEIRLWPQKEKVMVQLNDSGPGIAAELKGDLFIRPSILSTGRRRAGGLGLMIVKRILELHGSDITLIDSPGKGACFEFSVPI